MPEPSRESGSWVERDPQFGYDRRRVHALVLVLVAAGGPLGLRTQGPLRELFLEMTAADARPIGRTDLDIRWTVANTWNQEMTLERGTERATQLLDEQADSLTLRIRAPWPQFPDVWTAVEWKITQHWGGWSDAPIESWHSLTGAFNYRRSLYSRNQVGLIYADAGGTAFAVRSAKLAPGDLTARTQVALVEAPVAIAARLDLKLPIGSLAAAGGSGGFDAGAGVVATWPVTSWATLHGLVALSRFSHLSAPTALQPKRWHFTAEASLELEVLGATLLIEDRVLSPLLAPGWNRVEDGAPDDDALLSSGLYADFRAHNQISFGLRRGPFSFWISEDFTPGRNSHSVLHWMWVSNAPDVVFGIAFTQPL
jgi:uncharacterized protein DUF3187